MDRLHRDERDRLPVPRRAVVGPASVREHRDLARVVARRAAEKPDGSTCYRTTSLMLALMGCVSPMYRSSMACNFSNCVRTR